MPLNGGSGKKVDFMGFSGDSELPFNQVVWGSNPQCLITCRLFNGHSLKSLFFCCFGVYHGGNGGVGSGGRDIKCLYRLWEPPSAALDLGSCIIFVMVYCFIRLVTQCWKN